MAIEMIKQKTDRLWLYKKGLASSRIRKALA